MTALQVVETGEVVEQMTEEEASSITTRISVKLDAIADNYESVMPLIRDAITRQAYVALGYVSPGAYVADRFGHALSRLGIELRREVVRELSEAGLSTRAIAPVVAVSHVTVATDIAAGVKPLTPAPVFEPSGMDEFAPSGRAYDMSKPDEADAFFNDLSEDEPEWGGSIDDDVEAASDEYVTPAAPLVPRAPEARKVTGVDGRKYAQTKQAKPDRRSDLTKTARTLSTDLYRITNRIQKLREDDRLGRNAEQVTSLMRGHLSDCIEVCQDLLDALPTKESTE